MKAVFVRDLDWYSDARLYELTPPLTCYMGWDNPEVECKLVVVSAVNVDGHFGGPETYIFPWNDKRGEAYLVEQQGSQRGILDHHKVLNDLGYEVEE